MVKIEARKVSLGYAHRPVLNDVSFTVGPGDLVGLIGPNGSGKSTVIRTLAHTIQPLQGTVLLNDRNIAAIPRRELAQKLGVVPQLPLLPSAFTAFEVVLMGRNPHLGLFQYETPRDMEIAWKAMGMTGTQDLFRRRVGELSGGEIQCVLIARVLAQETEAVLLDEPTANLDIGRQVDVLDLMRRLCREKGLAVLAALHDLNLAAQYCTKLVLVNAGRVHAQGTPAEVITEANIKEVYGAEHCVYAHPVNGLPAVLVSPEGAGRRNGQRGTGEAPGR